MQSFDIVGRGHAIRPWRGDGSHCCSEQLHEPEPGVLELAVLRTAVSGTWWRPASRRASGRPSDRRAMYQEKMIAVKAKIKKVLVPGDDHHGRDLVDRGDHDLREPVVQERVHEFRRRLPAPTLVVIACPTSSWRTGTSCSACLFGGIYFLIRPWKRSPKIQATIDRLALKLPVLGEMLQKAAIARWSRTSPPPSRPRATGRSARFGRPLVRQCGDKEATKQVETLDERSARAWRSPCRTSACPQLAIDRYEIGEESGSLDSCCEGGRLLRARGRRDRGRAVEHAGTDDHGDPRRVDRGHRRSRSTCRSSSSARSFNVTRGRRCRAAAPATFILSESALILVVAVSVWRSAPS